MKRMAFDTRHLLLAALALAGTRCSDVSDDVDPSLQEPLGQDSAALTAQQEIALCQASGLNVIIGTSNNDTLNGTANADCIAALGGQDTVNGLGGNDRIFGGDGDDTLNGGPGNDDISGGSGQDKI